MNSRTQYLLVTSKNWHLPLYDKLVSYFTENKWHLISAKEDFNILYLDEIQPDKIFIPHWSHIIPEAIYSKYECIVFHMTDLPYGRGGSPLQNLIVRGYSETKISAIKVDQGIDTGNIYLKYPLTLAGTAEEIFIRASDTIFNMIKDIILKEPVPKAQVGEVVEFKRRKPEDGNLLLCKSTRELYDFIRMLDAEGYPSAFIETENFRFEFSRASLKANDIIISDVRISKK